MWRRSAARARALQRDILAVDHRAPVLAPLLDELGAALFLDVVMRDGGGGLRSHGEAFLYIEARSPRLTSP
jgi:hypothetical protein